MWFSKGKRRLRREADDRLLRKIMQMKEQRHAQKVLLSHCIDPSDELLYEMKLMEVKYFFLLKEAKIRNVSME